MTTSLLDGGGSLSAALSVPHSMRPFGELTGHFRPWSSYCSALSFVSLRMLCVPVLCCFKSRGCTPSELVDVQHSAHTICCPVKALCGGVIHYFSAATAPPSLQFAATITALVVTRPSEKTA